MSSEIFDGIQRDTFVLLYFFYFAIKKKQVQKQTACRSD